VRERDGGNNVIIPYINATERFSLTEHLPCGSGFSVRGSSISVRAEKIYRRAEKIYRRADGISRKIDGFPAEALNIPGDVFNIPAEALDIPGEALNIPGEARRTSGGIFRFSGEARKFPGERLGCRCCPVVLGWAIAGETLTVQMMAGAAIIIASVALITLQKKPKENIADISTSTAPNCPRYST